MIRYNSQPTSGKAIQMSKDIDKLVVNPPLENDLPPSRACTLLILLAGFPSGNIIEQSEVRNNMSTS